MPDVIESIELKKAAINAVFSSRAFAKCPNLARLFQYICQKYLEGSASDLKEYNIGVDALGRPSDFDPSKNAIVRVEVYRLREKLKKYYQGEGKSDALVISLPSGSYIPQFTQRGEITEPRLPEEPASGHPQKVQSKPVVLPPQPPPPAGPKGPVSIIPVNLSAKTGAGPGAPRWLSGLKHPALIKFYLFIIVGLLIAIGVLATRKSTYLPAEARSGSLLRASATPAVNSAQRAVRILAGYTKAQYVDRAGHVWQGDRDYEGGGTSSQPEPLFARTLDPTLFRTFRSGDFSYNIPLHPGTYELRLYFAEATYGPDTLSGGGEGSRIFTVTANGKPLLSNFDVLSDAGGNGIADVRVFKDITPGPDGYLHLKFGREISDPFVDAIEAVPSEQGKINSIRIATQEDCFTDHAGNLWSPDRYFRGGRLAVRKIPVSNTPDPGLFSGERYGSFSYAIPVAEGKYKLTLKFAETYFGPNNAGGGGVGSRVFDVYCNGVALLRNFDVFKQAGAENRALEETFNGLRPNAQGKLVLEFVPVVNYASVNAIEVVDESK
ncbi:MAG TPA: malectin domain-containing carbohydrate-binding protein [Terriglobia bacterium]|nr:malectin domain-containing carbohydrate-binding protein [Terriglobia bacterium]